MEVEVHERLNELQATFQPEEQEIEYSVVISRHLKRGCKSTVVGRKKFH